MGNCVPFLTLLADQATGRGYPLVTLLLIRLPRNTLPLSPRSKLKQELPLAKPCLLSSSSSLSCVITYVIGRFYHPYPPGKVPRKPDLAFFCLDFYSGDRPCDRGRVYTIEVLLFPGKQGLLFHHEFRKPLRGNNSNVFALKTCSHESIVCPIVNLATYVKLADLMNISLREGSLFRASDSKGQVSSKPFVGSAVASLLASIS